MTDHPPTRPQPLVALGIQTFRVYGLTSDAWLAARRRGRDDEASRHEICTAVETALMEDAGGFGTAGFHTVRPFYWCDLALYDGLYEFAC